MEDDLHEDPRPVERFVSVQGHQVPLQEWEDEVILRSAAWIACIHGVAGIFGVVSYLWLPMTRWMWFLLIPLAIGAMGWRWVHSRAARLALLLVCAGAACVWTASIAVEDRGLGEVHRFAMELAGDVLAITFGRGLLRRSTLARDGLLVLSAVWVVWMLPFQLLWGQLFGSLPWRLAGSRLPVLTLSLQLVPAGFVLYALATRPGRMLHRDPPERRPLASLSIVRSHLSSVRALAAVLLIAVAAVGAILDQVLLTGGPSLAIRFW